MFDFFFVLNANNVIVNQTTAVDIYQTSKIYSLINKRNKTSSPAIQIKRKQKYFKIYGNSKLILKRTKMLGKKIKRAASNNQNESQTQSDPKCKLTKNSSQMTQSITSPFFESMPFWQQIFDIECRLSAELKSISFLSPTISAVYNPIEYAAELHCAYLKKFLNKPKPVVFIGMNPGPFGMVQTGVTNIHLYSILFQYAHSTSDANF